MAQQSVHASQKPVPPSALHFDYLSNGSTTNAIGDYGAAVERFKITCESGIRKLYISRLIVYIEDVGNFQSGKYGTDIVLTEGIHVMVHNADDSMAADLTAAQPIITNAQWGALCYDVTVDKFGTGNNNSLIVRWTFSNAGAPVTLSQGQYLAVDLNDDFSGLVKHTFMAQGYYA